MPAPAWAGTLCRYELDLRSKRHLRGQRRIKSLTAVVYGYEKLG